MMACETGTLKVLGLPIWNPIFEEFKEWFELEAHAIKDQPALLGIANAYTLNLACAKPHYKWSLLGHSVLINDGAGIGVAARMRGKGFAYNFNGTDLFPRLFSEIDRPLKVFLYGASEESNRGAAEEIERRFPMVKIVGRVNGFCRLKTQHQTPDILDLINASGADLLLVALGQPRQELWLHRNRKDLAVNIACGVGALFDFLSGTVERAPLSMRRMRLEWVYRLLREPRRMFRRYVIGNPKFLWRAWRSRAADLAVARKETAAMPARTRAA